MTKHFVAMVDPMTNKIVVKSNGTGGYVTTIRGGRRVMRTWNKLSCAESWCNNLNTEINKGIEDALGKS